MARRLNRLHNVEFGYYRVTLPLGQPTTALFNVAFKLHAPNNTLSVVQNVAGTQAIVKAPFDIAGITPLEVYDDPPVALLATAAWSQA